MSSKLLALTLGSCLGLTACFKTPLSSVGSVSRVGAASGAIANTEGTTTEKAISTVDANAENDVLLTAPAVEGLSGAQVTIAPGSLGISVDLVVEQASDLSETSMVSEMGLAGDIQVAAATPGMIIRPSENVDLKKPLTLAMPVPANLAFYLASGSKYAIFYKYFDPADQKLMTGMKIVDGVNVKLQFDEKSGKDVLTFEGYFGAYWSAILSREVAQEEILPPKPAEEPIMNKAKVPVIANTGVMKETEVVKMQVIPELVWDKPFISFAAQMRTLTVKAVVPQGQKVEACKVDIYESINNKTGLSFDTFEGPSYVYTIPDGKAYNLVGRFRCKDSNARVTVTPWSDSVAIPAIPSANSAMAGVDLIAGGGLVSISGKLNPFRSLMLATISGGEGKPSFQNIPVDPAGNFNVVLDRSSALAASLLTRIQVVPIDRNPAFYQDAATVFGVSLAEAQSHISSMTDAEVRGEFETELQQIITQGTQSLLIAYDKSPATPNRVTEAQSFKFLGFKTPNGNAIFSFSTKNLKGNVRLGEVVSTANSDEILTSIPAAAMLNETSESLELMARTSRSAKLTRNAHMNDSWKGNIYSLWTSPSTLTSLQSVYSSAADMVYQGYGFYMDSDSQPFTLGDICAGTPSHTLEWLAPALIQVNVGGTVVGANSFTNGNSVIAAQGADDVCQGQNFYARIDSDQSMLNFGTGGSFTGQIPVGLWKLSHNATEVARFEFGSFRPFLPTGQASVIVPIVKMTVESSLYMSASIKFYLYSNDRFTQLTDLSLVRKMVGEPRFSMWGTGTEFNSDIIWPSTGSELTVNLGPNLYTSEYQSAAFEYKIGSHSMRFEFRNAP